MVRAGIMKAVSRNWTSKVRIGRKVPEKKRSAAMMEAYFVLLAQSHWVRGR